MQPFLRFLPWVHCMSVVCKTENGMSKSKHMDLDYQKVVSSSLYIPVLAVDDRHVPFCEYNGSVTKIICVAVATLANEKLLELASDNDLLLCRKSTSNKTRYRQ